MQNFVVRAKLSGHNNEVCLVDFLDSNGSSLGNVCIKYSSNEKMKLGLTLEASILSLLYSRMRICPKLIDLSILKRNNVAYIVMETVKGTLINHSKLSIEKAVAVLNAIQFHERILLDNMQSLDTELVIKNLDKKIDFKKKILVVLKDFVPSSNFLVNDSLSFLNYYLNNERIIKKRIIVTDRSAENIFQGQNGELTFIDFSTVRVGTQFDNLIQFVDDPRIKLTFKKEDLIEIFFKKNNLNAKDLEFFYASSVYTNLLQGIFTYVKNPKLGIKYFENANEAYTKLKNKKVR